MIRARLDRNITIQSLTTTQDDSGQPIESWSTFATIWAERKDTTGRERFQSNQVLPERVATFRFYWIAGITETMRVVDAGSYYDIKGINENQRENYIELSCTALNPAATV